MNNLKTFNGKDPTILLHEDVLTNPFRIKNILVNHPYKIKEISDNFNIETYIEKNLSLFDASEENSPLVGEHFYVRYDFRKNTGGMRGWENLSFFIFRHNKETNSINNLIYYFEDIDSLFEFLSNFKFEKIDKRELFDYQDVSLSFSEFCKMGLNRPGTTIRTCDNNYLLIGDINTNGISGYDNNSLIDFLVTGYHYKEENYKGEISSDSCKIIENI